MYYLGIDLGGTNIAVGIVDEENKIIARANSKTQTENAEQVADAMAETARKALESAGLTLADVPWIGVGSPGTINKSTGIIEFANNLPFKNTPMQEMLSQRLEGKQVLMENDANAAAFGEYMAGALKGSDNAIAITLGTGVGGGIIINHKIYSGSNFAGAELGHTVIVVDGRPCTCGRHGCWETYASATGLIKTTKEHMADAPKDSPLWTLADGSMDNVNGRTAFDAMRQGDPVGKEIVDEYIHYFSVGLIDMINIFQPDILCVGGGISNEGETLLAPVREYVEKEQYAMNSTKKTTICRAKLGNDAGIIGAALLGKMED
ncbi:ROK family glucokinase [Acutalibacter sp. JLR.KK004]|jgi:glucokinase|uniref:ROK family protein n=1 Tax=Acutalibacter sp. JLR.KK004 TaxID=3112622 RepID=UPI002170786E|nr:ROK family glucokinase [Acutalibacter sp.]